MRELNRPLALKLLIVVVVVLLGVCSPYIGLHAIQVRRNADFFKDKAESAHQAAEEANKEMSQRSQDLASKEYVKAIQYLGWYLRIKPDNVDALQDYAMQSADWADRARDSRSFTRALSRLEAVLRLDPKRDNVRRRLIDMAMKMRPEKGCPIAKSHLEALVPGIDNPKTMKPSPDHPEWPELMRQYGQCLRELTDYDKAVAAFERAIDFAPDEVEAYAELADILRTTRLSRPNDADAWMDKMVEVNPNSAKAQVLFARYLWKLANEDRTAQVRIAYNAEALARAQRALELRPTTATRCIGPLNVPWSKAESPRSSGSPP